LEERKKEMEMYWVSKQNAAKQMSLFVVAYKCEGSKARKPLISARIFPRLLFIAQKLIFLGYTLLNSLK